MLNQGLCNQSVQPDVHDDTTASQFVQLGTPMVSCTAHVIVCSFPVPMLVIE